MKIKTKILLAFGYFIALAAGYLFGILGNYSGISQNQVSGTFGKVEKYKKVQMTSKDLELRSEILSDTAKLRGIIGTLTYFSLFTDRVSSAIDASLLTYIEKGMGGNKDETDRINGLKDYAEFIRNHNNTVGSTISMLSGFYLNQSADASHDVEKTLNHFGHYVKGLVEREKAMSQGVESMMNFTDNLLVINPNDKEVRQLKSTYNQFLIRAIQLAAVTNSNEAINILLSSVISKDEDPNEIQEIFVGSEIEGKSKAGSSKSKILLYNNQTMKFSTSGEGDYARETSNGSSVTFVAKLSSGKAEVLIPKYSPNEVIQFCERIDLKNTKEADGSLSPNQSAGFSGSLGLIIGHGGSLGSMGPIGSMGSIGSMGTLEAGPSTRESSVILL